MAFGMFHSMKLESTASETLHQKTLPWDLIFYVKSQLFDSIARAANIRKTFNLLFICLLKG